MAQAEEPYGRSVRESLKAIDQLCRREGRLEGCMAILQLAMPKAALWQRIRVLARSLTRLAPPA